MDLHREGGKDRHKPWVASATKKERQSSILTSLKITAKHRWSVQCQTRGAAWCLCLGREWPARKQSSTCLSCDACATLCLSVQPANTDHSTVGKQGSPEWGTSFLVSSSACWLFLKERNTKRNTYLHLLILSNEEFWLKSILIRRISSWSLYPYPPRFLIVQKCPLFAKSQTTALHCWASFRRILPHTGNIRRNLFQ